jgi:TolB protein
MLILLVSPSASHGRIYIDINAPSLRKFKIAIPHFKNLGSSDSHPELAARLPEVVANDLDLSGYFSPMDKESFLEDQDKGLTLEKIRFRNWSVIGAELLLKGGYTTVGTRVEVEVRLYDVTGARQIFGKRGLGESRHYRYLMHRIGDEIIRKLTGQPGFFTTKLAFVGTASGHKEIYVCDYDGYNLQQMSRDRSIALLPRLSPDGKKMLYNSYKDGGPMLYLKDLISGKARRISARSGLNIGAAWAPEGKHIALTLSERGNSNIFSMGLNGHIIKQLTLRGGSNVSPAFSPDGKKMAFVSSRSGSPQIYVLNLESGREERLTFEGKYNTSPSWSAINRIAFVSRNGGHFDIYSINVSSGRTRRLTENQGNNEDPCWSPDGRYMVFSSNRQGRYHLYLMNSNGDNQRKITSLKGDQTAPSWSP